MTLFYYIRNQLMLIGLLLPLLLSCNAGSEVKICEALKSSLLTWGLVAEVHKSDDKDIFTVMIRYKKWKEGPRGKSYYLDQFSNELIVNFLIYQNRDIFDLNHKPFKLHISFEDAPDVGEFIFDKETFEYINSYFKSDFYTQNLNYLLSEFGYQDIVFLDNLIKLISNEMFENKYQDNFWEALREYSYFCEKNDKKFIDSTAILIVAIGMLNEADLGPNEPKEAGRKLLPIILNCNIDPKIYQKGALTMMKYLESK